MTFTLPMCMADLMGMAVGVNKSSGQFGRHGHNGVALRGYKRDCRAGLAFVCYNHISKLNNPMVSWMMVIIIYTNINLTVSWIIDYIPILIASKVLPLPTLFWEIILTKGTKGFGIGHLNAFFIFLVLRATMNSLFRDWGNPWFFASKIFEWTV